MARCQAIWWQRGIRRYVSVGCCWPFAIVATADPHLDLHLADYIHLASLGALSYVLLHRPTLGAALAQLCRYQVFLLQKGGFTR